MKSRKNTLYFGLYILVMSPFWAFASVPMAIGLAVIGLLIALCSRFVGR